MARRPHAVVLAAACLAAPAAAHGATVEVVTGFALPAAARAAAVPGSGLVVRAAPGEVNHLTLVPAGDELVVRDTSAPLVAGDRCRATAPGEVTCTPELLPWATASISAGDGDDVVGASAAGFPVLLMGGPGDDVLLGGQRTDILTGDDGRDVLIGGPGADSLTGGPGADRLDGGDGDDVLDLGGDSPTALREFATCGDGRDLVQAPDGLEAVSVDCDRVAFGVRGTSIRPLVLALPLRRVPHGARAAAWCDPGDGGSGCDATVTVKRRNGAHGLRGKLRLRPSPRAARLVLRGARLRAREAVWVSVRGQRRAPNGDQRLQGGFKVIVP